MLWIIGLDEDGHAVRPLESTDPANWWPAVQKRFADGVTPDLTDVVVGTSQGTVVALYFETDRSPYLVKAKSDSGVQTEVPWRSGTTTRSAHRHEVLSMLVPAVQTPEISLLGARCHATLRAEEQESLYGREGLPAGVTLRVEASLFVTATAQVMLPKHLWRMTLTGTGRSDPVSLEVRIYRPIHVQGQQEPPYGAAARDSGLFVNGPDVIPLEGEATLPIAHQIDVARASRLDYDLVLPVAGSERRAMCTGRLTKTSPFAQWPDTFAWWSELDGSE